MKILSASQIREADAYTILHEPVSSLQLMERASGAFTKRFLSLALLKPGEPVDIYCGPGNNGGDGLVIARMLSVQGFSPHVFLLPGEKYSPDYQANLEKLRRVPSIPVQELSKDTPGGNATLIIDALFGTGLNKPLQGLAAEVIRHINASKATVVAVDMPSGLPCDTAPVSGSDIIQAAFTLTFHQPKLTFFFADYAPYVGYFQVLDIGLHAGFISSLVSPNTYADAPVAASLLNPRAKFSHKGDYGHALLVAGSYGKMGAAVLAVKACLRSGAGLVSAHVPACGYSIMQVAAPEAMVYADAQEHCISSHVHLDPFTAVGVGPGIGLDKQTGNILKLLLQQSARPLVIDADALNILSENKTWLHFIPRGSILTPHPKEFDRLTGMKGSSFDRFEWQKDFSRKYGVYVVLKGAHTAVSSPEGEVSFNASGNPGMAKGGSGDVLTGLLTGLLAQGYVPFEAAVLGVYLHGLAGDITAQHLSMEALTAGDLVSALGEAWLRLRE